MVKWSKRKYDPWSTSYEITAKRKNIYASVVYNDFYDHFYFILHRGTKNNFNSLWEYKPFQTETACIAACESEIERKAKEWSACK